MSETELLELKEQIKQELLAEMNKKKENQNNWKRLKEEYKDVFNKFNYTEHFEGTNINGDLITRDTEILNSYPLQTSIGTLLRIKNKAKNVGKMDMDYEEMKNTVDKILEAIK